MTQIKNSDLSKLLLAGYCCDDFYKQGLYKIISMAITDGVFDLTTFRDLESRLWLVSKNSDDFDKYDYAYKNFNPLADYGYSFLFAENNPNGKNRYIVLLDKAEVENA